MQWDTESSFESTAKGEPLTSPHFDDERTLLSARPVVPLEVASKSRLRLQVPAAVAFFLILLTAGALIQLGRGRMERSLGWNTSADSADHLSGETTDRFQGDIEADQPSTSSESNPEPDYPIVAQQPELGLKTATRKHQRQTNKTASVNSARGINVNNLLENSPDDRIRRHLRREARRLKRQAERAAERDRIDAADGIFRIEDIFEGSRRP